MKILSLSILDSFNKFLNLVVGVTIITSLVALFDFSNQHAEVSIDVFTVAVWIDEPAIIRYYEVHNYKIPDIVVEYLNRSARLVIPNLEKAILGKYDYYFPDDELLPNVPYYEHYEIEKKLQLQSYNPIAGGKAGLYSSNSDEWINQLLPEVKELSQIEGRKLELAILGARRVESTISLVNKGDLVAKNIKIYINAVRNLVSGAKGSILSITSMRPGPKPLIEDYRAEINFPVLKPKYGNAISVFTREAPVFRQSIDLDYDTQRIVNARKLATVFGSLMTGSLVIVVLFSLTSKKNKEPSVNSSSNRFVKNPSEKILRKEIIVPASLKEVWDAWTTTEGVKTFFSSDAKVELAVGGPYEIYFILENPYGLKGSEDCKILSYLPMEMLSFDWGAPPEFGELRNRRTQVILQFEEIDPGKVKIKFSQYGWGKSKDWERLYDYFDKAWSYVLGNLKKRFIEGPIDWKSKG